MMKAVGGKVILQVLENTTDDKLEDGIWIPGTVQKKKLHNRLTIGKVLSITDTDSEKHGLKIDDEVLFDTLSATYSMLEKKEVSIPIENVVLVKE